MARMYELHQAWYDQHGDERTDSARPKQETCRLDRLADQVLHEWCHQGHCAKQHHADDHHEDAAADEIAVLEHLEPHERFVRGQRMSEEIVEAGRRNDRFDPDFPRIEPADLITAI